MSTGEDGIEASVPATPFGITNPTEHLTKVPTLRYSFRNPILDPMNDNYKFSRRLEMSVFGRSAIRDYIVANFRPEKVQRTDEDLGTVDSQAQVVFYTYAGVEMYKITSSEADAKKLKPASFTAIMKEIVAKHTKQLRSEVKEYEAWKKEQEKTAEQAEKANGQ